MGEGVSLPQEVKYLKKLHKQFLDVKAKKYPNPTRLTNEAYFLGWLKRCVTLRNHHESVSFVSIGSTNTLDFDNTLIIPAELLRVYRDKPLVITNEKGELFVQVFESGESQTFGPFKTEEKLRALFTNYCHLKFQEDHARRKHQYEKDLIREHCYEAFAVQDNIIKVYTSLQKDSTAMKWQYKVWIRLKEHLLALPSRYQYDYRLLDFTYAYRVLSAAKERLSGSDSYLTINPFGAAFVDETCIYFLPQKIRSVLYKTYTPVERSGGFQVRVMNYTGKYISLGTYKTVAEATAVYNKYKRETLKLLTEQYKNKLSDSFLWDVEECL